MYDVLFLTKNGFTPSTRVRVIDLIPEFEKFGLACTVIPYPRSFSERLKVYAGIRRFDLVVLQKKLPAYLDYLALRSIARKLVYDFDDAVYYRHDSDGVTKSRSRLRKFSRIVRNADLVLAGNRVLYEFASQFNEKVEMVPSAVETRNAPLKIHGQGGNRIIIGWIGSSHTMAHLETAVPVLSSLARTHALELRVISNEPLDVPGVHTTFIPWQLETQARDVSNFDIGIMPLPDNEYTRGKCGYKALQYMAAGVPSVVSDVGVNSQIVSHGQEGLVATTDEELHKHLETLIGDGALRKQLGENARRKVEREYSISVVGERLSRILLGIIKGIPTTSTHRFR